MILGEVGVEGSKEWVKLVGGYETSAIKDLLVTPSGKILVTGYSQKVVGGNSNVLLASLSLEGDLEWSVRFTSSDFYEPTSLLQSASGGYLVSGYVQWASSSSLFLIQVDEDISCCGDLELKWVRLETTDVTSHSALVFETVSLISSTSSRISHYSTAPSLSNLTPQVSVSSPSHCSLLS